MPSVDRMTIQRFIAQQKLAVVSSLSPAGKPQSALVGIASGDQMEIVFDTIRSTRKFENMIANPEVSLVIGLGGAITVQYEGKATELQGEDLAEYQKLYFEAWPDGPSRLEWEGITYFLVVPAWIRYSDFSQTPPVITEIECHGFRQLTPYGRVR
ncbi:MAG: pyridoxamine 5'-phosphate oxidase family protein [Bryobacteraceae bacterium]